MSEAMDNWAEAERNKRKWLAEHGMYSETEEKANCGVGLVVSIDGQKSRKVVEAGINALKAIWHRGAVDADGKTGDGAGIHVQIPVPFFHDQIYLAQGTRFQDISVLEVPFRTACAIKPSFL